MEALFHKGVKGFRLFHDSEYFKERRFFHTDNMMAEKWTRAVMEHAACYDVTKKYERLNMLGKGKFSTVYLCHSQEQGNDEMLAMKFIGMLLYV